MNLCMDHSRWYCISITVSNPPRTGKTSCHWPLPCAIHSAGQKGGSLATAFTRAHCNWPARGTISVAAAIATAAVAVDPVAHELSRERRGRLPGRSAALGKRYSKELPMPLFEVETDAHIIITWAADET